MEEWTKCVTCQNSDVILNCLWSNPSGRFCSTMGVLLIYLLQCQLLCTIPPVHCKTNLGLPLMKHTQAPSWRNTWDWRIACMWRKPHRFDKSSHLQHVHNDMVDLGYGEQRWTQPLLYSWSRSINRLKDKRIIGKKHLLNKRDKDMNRGGNTCFMALWPMISELWH